MVESFDDCFGAFAGGGGGDVDQFVAVGLVAVAVDLFEDEGVFIADAAGLLKPSLPMKNTWGWSTASRVIRSSSPSSSGWVSGRGRCSARRCRSVIVVELHGDAGVWGLGLLLALEGEDLVDEIVVVPRLGSAACLLAGDDGGGPGERLTLGIRTLALTVAARRSPCCW